MRPSAILALLATSVLLSVAAPPNLHTQITPGSVSLGFEVGPAHYIGEFNSLEPDNSFHLRLGWDGFVHLSYHIDDRWSIGGMIGFQRLSFSIDSAVRTKYSTNFFGPVGTTTFLSSPVAFTEDYESAVTHYGLFGKFNLIPDGAMQPYLALGMEGFAFQAFNDSGVELPETMTGPIAHRSLAVSLGAGVGYPMNGWLSATLAASFYVPFTDYLDGYAHYLSFETSPGVPGPGDAPTLNDHAVSLRLGLSAVIYKPSPRPVEEPPPPVDRTPQQSPGTSTPSTTSTGPATPSPQPPSAREAPRSTRADTAADGPSRPVDSALRSTAPPTEPPPVRASQTPRPSPSDSDGDGLLDADETGRYLTDPARRDTDGDFVGDRDELFRFNTSPNNPDTDGDGMLDGQEVFVYKTNPLVRDTDRDGIPDGEEILKLVTDPLRADSDGDGLYDRAEVERGTSPINRDSDNDGVDDRNDACPTSFGPAVNGGCPDQ